jgi:hypothetical protein
MQQDNGLVRTSRSAVKHVRNLSEHRSGDTASPATLMGTGLRLHCGNGRTLFECDVTTRFRPIFEDQNRPAIDHGLPVWSRDWLVTDQLISQPIGLGTSAG